MLNKIFSFLLVAFGSCCVTMSALGQARLVFDAKEIDLGYMPEDTGNVLVEFYFTNSSTSSVLISEIDTYGGCSLVSWPNDSIPAKTKGKIVARVNPKNRPGPFVRMVQVNTLPDSAQYELMIKSYIEPSAKVWNENTNETNFGKVVVSSDYIRVGTVLENARVEKSLKIKNTGAEIVRFPLSKLKLPSYVTLKGLPEKLLVGSEATLYFTIDFSTSNKLGSYTEMLEIPMEQGPDKELIIYLIGKISPVVAQSAGKPVVEMLLREVDLGEVSANKPVQGSFVMKNAGLSPLLIRKVETSCQCLTLEPKNPIVPNTSATLYFTLNPRGLAGWEEKKIILYTNAPDQPIITLIVKAKIIP